MNNHEAKYLFIKVETSNIVHYDELINFKIFIELI